MADEMEIEDGSNDKAYFTMVPNIVLNHSSAVDQALYMQMKRFAGEKSGGGLCTASKRTLKDKLKIGYDALNKSIEYLISHGWISFAGEKVVITDGGPQKINTYRVNDIWKLNAQHYKGAPESDPLAKVLPKPSKVLLKSPKVLLKHDLYRTNKTIEPGELEDEHRVDNSLVPFEEKPATKTRAKYADARIAFSWLPNRQASWDEDLTQLKCGLLLFKRGEDAVRKFAKYVQSHSDEDGFNWTFTKPSDYERKWEDIKAYAKRNS